MSAFKTNSCPVLSKISCSVFHINSTKYFVVNISSHTQTEKRVLHIRRSFLLHSERSNAFPPPKALTSQRQRTGINRRHGNRCVWEVYVSGYTQLVTLVAVTTRVWLTQSLPSSLLC